MRESQAWELLAERIDALDGDKGRYLCYALGWQDEGHVTTYGNHVIRSVTERVPLAVRRRMVARIRDDLDGAIALDVHLWVRNLDTADLKAARVLACLMFGHEARDRESQLRRQRAGGGR